MIRLAIVGFGKIARDQHVAAIAATPGITLAAVASRNAALDGVAHYATLDDLLREAPEIEAVALCTPPQVRRAQAAAAIEAGKHVLLEKPPGATVSELGPLIDAARTGGKTLFAAWHSRFAPAVGPARALLAERAIRSVEIVWKEDVRVWHPGQAWIFEPGGLGVFDPAINAFSILTAILPHPVFVTRAELDFPANRAAPIAAEIDFSDTQGVPVHASLNFLQPGPPSWDIHVETDAGRLTLSRGGAQLTDAGRIVLDEAEREYPALYQRFVELIGRGESEVDIAPLTLVADAYLLGRRRDVEPFED